MRIGSAGSNRASPHEHSFSCLPSFLSAPWHFLCRVGRCFKRVFCCGTTSHPSSRNNSSASSPVSSPLLDSVRVTVGKPESKKSGFEEEESKPKTQKEFILTPFSGRGTTSQNSFSLDSSSRVSSYPSEEESEPSVLGSLGNTLFTPDTRDQQTLKELVLTAFSGNRVLARSILTGSNLKTMERCIWFDLDQTQRQRMLHGKPYRDPVRYEALRELLKEAADDIQSLCNHYQKIHFNCCFLIYKYLQNKKAPTKEEIIEDLAKMDEEGYGRALNYQVYEWYADWTRAEYAEAVGLYNGRQKESIDTVFKWERPSYGLPNEQYMKFRSIDNILFARLDEELPVILEQEKRTIIESYRISLLENQRVLQAIRSLPKEKRIDFSDKEKAEKTLREYIDYRIKKNTCHQQLKRIFPEHQRKHGIVADPVETECGYFHGYQLQYKSSSVFKEIFPEVLDEDHSFSEENRVIQSQKAVAPPASWGNIYADLPIDLFKGRKGKIAFALIGIDEEMAIPYRSHQDLSITHLINPQYWGLPRLQEAVQSAEQVYQKKQEQRRAVSEKKCIFDDMWYHTDRKTSGHTEALVYGMPMALISCPGFEDVALEARRRYAAAGLISPEAPFFTYDPIRETPLIHISDEVMHCSARALCNSGHTDRTYYDPDSGIHK